MPKARDNIIQTQVDTSRLIINYEFRNWALLIEVDPTLLCSHLQSVGNKILCGKRRRRVVQINNRLERQPRCDTVQECVTSKMPSRHKIRVILEIYI